MTNLERCGPRCAAILAAADLTQKIAAAIPPDDLRDAAVEARRHALRAGIVGACLRAALDGRLDGRSFAAAREALAFAGASLGDVFTMAREGLEWAAAHRVAPKAAA